MKTKNIQKKIFIGIICFSLLFSNMSISIDAAWQAAVGKIFGEMVKEVVVQGAGHAVEKLVDTWFSGEKEYYDSPGEKTTMDYYANNSAVNKATGSISNSGANNENCYNTFSSTVTDKRTYSLIKDSYNATTNNYTTMLYNPITNNYTELNQTSNIYYNNQYDTYYIENNEYNYYVTNNYTYVSYYIINNETDEESYYEIYYELPDGRNSYDLEKEDIWGEYFIYDVVGYESIQEDDGKTLALYHLDGDGKDSSYWKNHDFPLGDGAFSEVRFGNGLYINTSHDITLPSDFDINNFTLEFFIRSGDFGSWGFVVFGDNSYLYNVNVFSNALVHYVLQCDNGNFSVYRNGAKASDLKYVSTSGYRKYGFLDLDIGTDGLYHMIFKKPYNGSGYVSYLLDEVRLSNCALYSGDNISVPTQPFDTNQVLVVPENPTKNMLAVQGKYVVSGFRVGGVRPTYPTKGFVYIYLEDDVVKDIQQYEGDAWYSINGAIYMDGEWVDLSGCNLSTLRFEEETPDDDSGGDSDNSSGGSGNDSSGGSVSGNGSGSSGSGISDLLGGIGKIFDTLLSLIGKLMGIVADFTESVLNLFTGFTTFTDGFTGFLSESFTFIPAEIWNLIALGLSLAILCAVINFLRK